MPPQHCLGLDDKKSMLLLPRHVQDHDELDMTETGSLPAPDFILPGRVTLLQQLPAEAMTESPGELGIPVATAKRISYECKPCYSGG